MSESLSRLVAEQLREEDSHAENRMVDMRVQWLEDKDSEEVILDVGGVWDRQLDRWVSDGDQCRKLRMHPGQYEGAYWFAEWLKYYVSGQQRPPHLEHVWTMLLAGGRRAGKNHLLEAILTTGCVAKPHGIIWGVSPVEDETEELQMTLEDWIHPSWAYLRALKWRFAHHTILHLRSAHKPSALKRGRVDICGLNEAQNMSKKAYAMVRAPIADRSGLVICAMNPPDEPKGRWVMDKYDEAKSGAPTLKLFEFDPRDNPYVNKTTLEDMKYDLGDLDYRREVLGEFIEIGDLVWYAWSPRHNICEIPADARDVTREFCRRTLGREFDYAMGIDLQLTPHMAAVAQEFFHDDAFPNDPLAWLTDEIVIEGDEYELIDEIESRVDVNGKQLYTPDNTALIIDASAWWQDSERTKGRGSVDMFRKRGWRWMYRPDLKMKRNPHIYDRVLCCNGRMKSAAGRRALFSLGRNIHTNKALKRWENRNGIPNRRSVYAHLSDAVSYLQTAFHPRRLGRKRGEDAIGYEKVKPKRSRRERDLDNL